MDLNNQDYRKELIKKAKDHFGSGLVARAKLEAAVYKGALKNPVKDYLEEQFGKDTADEMPLISSVNLTQRIVNQEASIYRNTPERTFSDVKKNKSDLLKLIYKDINADAVLGRANKHYKNSKQCFIQVFDKNKALCARIFKKHQIYVLADVVEPTKASVVVLPGYISTGGKTEEEDNKNSTYTVWSDEFNFICNGEGEISSLREVMGEQVEDLVNPIGKLPFIDIADEDKDFTFWAESDPALVDFTIQLNAALSDLYHIMRMQGWSYPIIKGPKDFLAQLQKSQVGINKPLLLPTDHKIDEDGNSDAVAEIDVIFASPSPDLQGCIDTISTLLSAFLSSRGVDPKTVSFSADSKGYSSGWERLLALIEKFEATKDDFEVFRKAEQELYNLICLWQATLYKAKGERLHPKYRTVKLDIGGEMTVKFAEPEMIETFADKIKRISEMETNGYISKVEALMMIFSIDREAAKARVGEMITDMTFLNPFMEAFNKFKSLFTKEVTSEQAPRIDA